jgi:hypothetical protein
MVKKSSPQFLYGMTAIMLISFGFIVKYSVNQSHSEAYLLFVKSPIIFLFALMFFIYSGITWTFNRMKKPLNNLLFYIHYSITIIVIGTMISITFFAAKTGTKTINEANIASVELQNRIVLLFVIFLCAQFVFIANMLKSVLQKTK